MVRKLRPDEADGVASASSSAKWPKLGTIESIHREVAGPDGRRLHGVEKTIAVHLLLAARATDDDPRAMIDIERSDAARTLPSLEEALGWSPKTLRKYIDALERRGLIEVKRDRRNGAATFYVRELVRAYAPERFGKDSRTVTSLKIVPVRESGNAVRESESVGSGNFPGPVRETFPVPYKLGTCNVVGTSPEHAALARRLGLKITRNADETEHVEFFANSPLRFGAALLVANTLDGWGLTTRRTRKLFRDHAFRTIAGAVGYVLEQIELSAQRSLLSEAERKRLDLPTVENPAALFEAALERGWSGSLPGYEDDPESPHGGGVSYEADVWAFVRAMLRRRLPPATYEIAFKHAALRCRDGAFVVIVANDFAASAARKAIDKVARCFAIIGYPNAEITIAAEYA